MKRVRNKILLLGMMIILCIIIPVQVCAKKTENYDLDTIPAYDGQPYVELNGNAPEFSERMIEAAKKRTYESYEALDQRKRCGVCVASIDQTLMPTEEREGIGQVKPSGWHTVKYNDLIEGNYLYNRCHLIGYQLTGENANRKNLVTGTRYLNIDGMLPFENQVAEYLNHSKNNKVLYRVTPIFEGDDLVCSGIQMEALSLNDNGKAVCFNVYCYNVQPGIVIDYATGKSSISPTSEQEIKKAKNAQSVANSYQKTTEQTKKAQTQTGETQTVQPQEVQDTVTQSKEAQDAAPQVQEAVGNFAVNHKNGKIHKVGSCPATGTGDNAMKEPVYFDTYEEAETYSIQRKPSLEKRKCGNCF